MSSKILKGLSVDKKSAAPSFLGQGGVVRKEEIKAQDKAQQIIEEAIQEAEKIKLEASRGLAQVEKEREEAKAQGREEGKTEGLEAFNEKLFELKNLKEKFFADAEPEMIHLVLNIAEKVIGEMAVKYKEVIGTIIRQAIERSLGDRVVVRLHPEDYKMIQEEEKGWKEKFDKTKHLHFKKDETIERGGCVVETEVGTIDAQLETQLKAIRKALGV